ncbi:MAG: phosphoenolpyruvate carboxylase [Armatimonadota bacterium]|nr:MAG: phosphoenolpyruvate carboxylase [Armatimonadota bacterium]
MNVSRCMSTQHPDNASVPFFASSPVLAGEDEIREAFYCYSHLGCDEQMWDVEGKEIDPHVVKKLLTFYPEFFRQNVLGRDLRLTVRVPNPSVERAEAKILLETLESIPRSFDAARAFYGDDAPPPIFEVILPMTTSAGCLNRVFKYYEDFIIARQLRPVREGDITVAQWIGDFGPARINVIPLFEDIPTMLRAGEILTEYLDGKDVEYQRVFLARSDTAMNYGLAAAALANKVALQQLYETGQKRGIPLCPIIGMGSAPFRGGLSPRTVERVSAEYPSVVTFTIQSAFKFDYPVSEVSQACAFLKDRTIGAPVPVDPGRAQALIQAYSSAYRRRVVQLAPSINAVARFVPPRRARKLHIGLFGYARELDGVSLPRAISFTCALYSLGCPPELLGLESLSDRDLEFLDSVYPSFRAKLTDALRYTDPESPFLTQDLQAAVVHAGLKWEPDEEHVLLTRRICESLEAGQTAKVADLLLQAALRRRFLG